MLSSFSLCIQGLHGAAQLPTVDNSARSSLSNPYSGRGNFISLTGVSDTSTNACAVKGYSSKPDLTALGDMRGTSLDRNFSRGEVTVAHSSWVNSGLRRRKNTARCGWYVPRPHSSAAPSSKAALRARTVAQRLNAVVRGAPSRGPARAAWRSPALCKLGWRGGEGPKVHPQPPRGPPQRAHRPLSAS